MLSFILACLSVLTMHFTLGPSLQLGRWDSQGPPAWAEAVLLRQEQPGSKLQEPGPLRHHKVCLTCKFANASLAFLLFSGMAVWDPFLILFYFSLVFTNPNIFVFLQSVLLIITSSWVFVFVLQYLQQISPFAVFDFAHSFQIILLYLCRPSSLPCFHKLLYSFVSCIWLYIILTCDFIFWERGWILLPLSFFSLTLPVCCHGNEL